MLKTYHILVGGEPIWRFTPMGTHEKGAINDSNYKEKILVINRTGATEEGGASLLAAVRNITDLPLIVAHSHGHGDHVRGDSAFSGQEDTIVVGLGAGGSRKNLPGQFHHLASGLKIKNQSWSQVAQSIALPG